MQKSVICKNNIDMALVPPLVSGTGSNNTPTSSEKIDQLNKHLEFWKGKWAESKTEENCYVNVLQDGNDVTIHVNSNKDNDSINYYDTETTFREALSITQLAKRNDNQSI